MVVDDGGPAYPHVETDPVMGTRVCQGMSLSDHFAGKALEGLVAHGGTMNGDFADVAAWCYRQADAMVTQSQKRRTNASPAS